VSFAPKATEKMGIAFDQFADRMPVIKIRGSSVLWFFVIYGYFLFVFFIYLVFTAAILAVWIVQVLTWIITAPLKFRKRR